MRSTEAMISGNSGFVNEANLKCSLCSLPWCPVPGFTPLHGQQLLPEQGFAGLSLHQRKITFPRESESVLMPGSGITKAITAKRHKWNGEMALATSPATRPRSHEAAADMSTEIPKKGPREGTKPLGWYNLRGYNLKKKTPACHNQWLKREGPLIDTR